MRGVDRRKCAVGSAARNLAADFEPSKRTHDPQGNGLTAAAIVALIIGPACHWLAGQYIVQLHQSSTAGVYAAAVRTWSGMDHVLSFLAC